ncbi:MAG TPA: HAD hydrolase-like protein [Acidobacteriaceae bacterium]
MANGAPRLLVFDLDGTLINSSLDLCASVNAALESVRKPLLPNALIASYIGDGAAMLVRRALGDPGDLDSLHPRDGDDLFRRTFEFFLHYYREHKLDNTHCYDGVLDALWSIRAGHPELLMAVLTNKPVIPSREICNALGLSQYFFQNYGGNSFETKKPDPEGLLRLIDEATSLLAGNRSAEAILPREVVMIGDSDVDVLTARRCGVRSVGCRFGLAPAALAAAGPDAAVDHPSEWPNVLGL